LKCPREQSLRETREKKGRKLKRNMRKGGKKKEFSFLIDWGATEYEKKIGEHVPTKKPQWRKKNIKIMVGGAGSATDPNIL
jgi:hypothetical protein